MVTYGPSSIVHECVILKKPILLLQIINESLIESMYDENLIGVCKNLNNIFSDINNIQNKKSKQHNNDEQIENLIGKFDGKCSERASNEILKILKCSE